MNAETQIGYSNDLVFYPKAMNELLERGYKDGQSVQRDRLVRVDLKARQDKSVKNSISKSGSILYFPVEF